MSEKVDGMQALRNWLHWATNETQLPPEERAARASDLDEFSVIDDAAAYLTQRGFASPDGSATTGEEDIAWCLTHHPQAFRDLCLEFARAIEKMRDLVPEAPQPAEPEDECEDSYEPGTIPWFRYAPMHMGRREGMSSVFARTLAETAQVVDEVRAARERRLSEVRRVFEGRGFVPLAEGVRASTLVGVDWGVSNTTNVRANPVPTDFGDGTHTEDILCGCGRYILRAGKFWADADAIHGQGRCGPTG